ncbi:uncharacterized protein [Watersipora subatra]|uniref:uncharacterized protein n=1 Tax=Watersipora subatra TaxID=2589382 RepID=UPI00355BE80F
MDDIFTPPLYVVPDMYALSLEFSLVPAQTCAAKLANQREELTKLKEELVESTQQIVDLQEADNHKTAELANQRQELVESQQQIVALQEANNQMTPDMAAMMGRLNRLDIYLRTSTDTDETGDQLHEPLS